MFLLNRFFLAFSLFFFVSQAYCPDDQYFVVLAEHYGPYNDVFSRVEIQSDSKKELFAVFKNYFNISRSQNHPFIEAKKAALSERRRNPQSSEIIEINGSVKTPSDLALPFKLFYGYLSLKAAYENPTGKQILPSELKAFNESIKS